MDEGSPYMTWHEYAYLNLFSDICLIICNYESWNWAENKTFYSEAAQSCLGNIKQMRLNVTISVGKTNNK